MLLPLNGEENEYGKPGCEDDIGGTSDTVTINDEIAAMLAQVYSYILSDAWGKQCSQDLSEKADDKEQDKIELSDEMD